MRKNRLASVSRRFGRKLYEWRDECRTKTEAQKRVKEFKNKGMLARIVKGVGKYTVYVYK